MTKEEIHRCFVEQLAGELESITEAAKKNIATVSNEEHKAESKYDTFSLETSYLARGQAMRVEALRDALERLQVLPLKKLAADDPIQLSALVRMEANDGEKRTLFFGPSGAGEEIEADGETILIVTSAGPLGKAVLGKRAGESFRIRLGPLEQEFTIKSVE